MRFGRARCYRVQTVRCPPVPAREERDFGSGRVQIDVPLLEGAALVLHSFPCGAFGTVRYAVCRIAMVQMVHMVEYEFE